MSCLSACCSGAGVTESTAKMLHLALQGVSIFATLVLFAEGDVWFGNIPEDIGIGECRTETEVGKCFQKQTTYRMAFVTALIMLGSLVSSICTEETAARALKSGFFFKLAALPAGFALCLVLPNGFFDVIQSIATVVGGLFWIAQFIILLHIGDRWNTNWVQVARNSGNRMWVVAIISVSGVFLGVSTGGTVSMSISFQDTPAALAVVVVSFVLSTIWVIVACTDWAKKGAMLSATLVQMFFTFVILMAAQAHPDTNAENAEVVTAVGFLFLIASMSGFAIDPETFLPSGAVSATTKEEGDVEAGTVGKSNVGSTAVFFLMHTIAALYVIPLLVRPEGLWSFWALGVVNWVMLVLYGVSLIGPQVCTGRDWS